MGKEHEKRFSGSSSESLHLLVVAEARVPVTGASRGYRVPLVQRLPSGSRPTPQPIPLLPSVELLAAALSRPS
jgi:hypothetical protein